MSNTIYNICIVSPGILPIPDVLGGAVERLITMIIQTNELEHRFDITVITIPNKNAKLLHNSYRYTKFVNLDYYINPTLKKWVEKINWHLRTKFECEVHLWNNFLSPVSKYLCKNSQKFDFYVSECSNPLFCHNLSMIVGKNRIAVHLHGNLLASKKIEDTFGNVFAVSNFIRNQYYRNSNLSPDRILTIFNGIDTKKFSQKLTIAEKIKLRESLGINKEDFVLIFCGRIVKDKGVLELINAFLSIDCNNVKLMILGSSNFGLGDFGSYPQRVKQLVDDNRNRIIFTGFVNNDDVYRYHQIADVGIMPSMHNDPCPLSMFELITSGLPTIATNAGGMPEIGTLETTIFVSMDNIEIELKNAIIRLYKNPIIREKMHIAALKRAEAFTQLRFYNDFCDTVIKLIKKNDIPNK